MYAFKTIGKKLSNWGRWGADDERGTLNHVSAQRVLAAASSIRQGKVFELSIPVAADGPQTGRNRINPVHLMSILPPDIVTPDDMAISDDFIVMPLQSGTHWDSLAHVGYDGSFYNGAGIEAVSARSGATRNSVDKSLPGMVGRGVLLDIARLHDVTWLPADHGIDPAQLEAAETMAKVRVGPGDALLVRTGWRAKALAEGWDGWLSANPGLTPECAAWLHEREVAAVASDNWGVELQPAQDGTYPLHGLLIRDMGMMLGEIFDLEALASDCSQDGQSDFFFSAPALRVVGGTGSLVSPIAIK